MPIGTITSAYQPPKIEDELVDVHDIEPQLNTNFEENAPQEEEIIHEVYESPGKKYMQESPEFHTHVDSKNLVERYLPKQEGLDKILDNIE